MGLRTGIQWCDATWNPWQGCTPVASGCEYCYMFREKRQYGQDPTVVVRSTLQTFNLPKKLEPGKRVFVNSWSDFFHVDADPWRAEAWDIIHDRPDLTFIIPTKRIERVAPLLPWGQGGKPWANVWLLASASTQAEVDEVVPKLLAVSSAMPGVSLEPLLGEINLRKRLDPLGDLDGFYRQQIDKGMFNRDQLGSLRRPILRWVIVAGESGGPANRALVQPHDCLPNTCGGRWAWIERAGCVDWVRSLRDQCLRYEVSFFFKGWGGPRPTSGGRLLDGREWNEYPRDAQGPGDEGVAGAGASGTPPCRAGGNQNALA